MSTNESIIEPILGGQEERRKFEKRNWGRARMWDWQDSHHFIAPLLANAPMRELLSRCAAGAYVGGFLIFQYLIPFSAK